MTPFLSLILSAMALLPAASPSPHFDADASVRYAKLYREVETKIRAGMPATAVKELQEAAQIYGQDGNVQMYLGQALLAKKDYAGAIAAYEKAIELGAMAAKYRANCYYDIACAHALQGDVKNGYEYLDRAMAAGFRDLQHLRTDTDLNALHADLQWETVAATKDVAKMKRDEGWRYDLWLLDRETRRVHYNPYRLYSAGELDRYVKDLDRQIPKLTDSQVMLAFQKYACMLGDGHTHARPAPESPLMKAIPIQAFWFEEGVFVTAAAPQHADLVGAEILKVEGKSIDEMAKILDPYIPRDNPQGLRNALPSRLCYPAALHALGVAQSPIQTSFTFKDSKGRTRDVSLAVVDGQVDSTWLTARKDATNPDPLYLKNRAKAYFFEPLPEIKAVYLQYNSVRSDPNEPLPAFCKKAFEYMDENGVENLIVDVRWNGGGNSFLNRNIQDAILARPKLNQKGHFFLITGRNTFSAAQNFTTDLVRNANPILVGEPTGSSPNFVGETVRLTLPYSKAICSISDLYWQRSWPMDHRVWLAPELPAPPVFSLYKENRDPAMEAIKAYLAESGR